MRNRDDHHRNPGRAETARWIVRVTASLLALPLLAYVAYAGMLYARQEAIIFPGATTDAFPNRAPIPAGAMPVELPASFGRVRAVFWPARGGAAKSPAILYTHGNYEYVEHSFAMMPTLTARGVAVLQLEFPGYGGADGKPTYETINEAARVAYDWLARAEGVDPTRIVAMGYSIGGGAACELARDRPVRGLVLLSTFTSIADFARERWLPAALVRVRYDNVACVRAYDGPLFIAHGRRDAIIPFESGTTLTHQRPRATFVPLDCGHDDCDFARTLFATRLPQWLADEGILPH